MEDGRRRLTKRKSASARLSLSPELCDIRHVAYDLAVFLWACISFGRRERAKWRAFVAGYRALRPESEAALEAAHLFVPIRHIWLMGEYAARTMEWGGRSAPAEWISSQLEFMRDWEERAIQPGLL